MKYIIFDADGTLLDSLHYWSHIALDYLKTFDIHLDESFYPDVKDLTLSQTAQLFIERFHINKTPQEIIDGINNCIADAYKTEILTKPHVKECLKLFYEKGYQMCVVTASDHDLVCSALERNGVLKYFQFVYTCDMAKSGKDEPYVYRNALEKLNGNKENCIVFEDAYYCMKTLKNEDMKVYAIYDDEHIENESDIRNICNHYFNNWKEVYEYEERLFD